MEIDIEKIKKRFGEIADAVSEIKRISALNDEEFWSKREYITSVKYHFLIAAEAVGSVCVHLAAKKLNKGVSFYGECFELLGTENIIDKTLSDRFQKLIRFRNLLIHRYWKTDDKSVLQFAREDLDIFDEFIKAIYKVVVPATPPASSFPAS